MLNLTRPGKRRQERTRLRDWLIEELFIYIYNYLYISNTMQVYCNGKDKHVNDIDVDDLVRPQVVLKGDRPVGTQNRFVLTCKHCPAKVIITRKMIEDYKNNTNKGA